MRRWRCTRISTGEPCRFGRVRTQICHFRHRIRGPMPFRHAGPVGCCRGMSVAPAQVGGGPMRSAHILAGAVVITCLTIGPAFADQHGRPAGTPHGNPHATPTPTSTPTTTTTTTPTTHARPTDDDGPRTTTPTTTTPTTTTPTTT